MPLLELHNISKRYPGVIALDDVHFELNAGEVHCLLGENGAGKSTLTKILSGAIERDSGSIALDGSNLNLTSPADAIRAGIAIIYQDRKLIPSLSVGENIFLGRESVTPFHLVDRNAMVRGAREVLGELGESIDPDAVAETLSPAQQQMVEIAKAVSRRVRVLVLDEPTAPLSDKETQNLFSVIRRLRGEGVGIIYISHRLAELFQVGDRVTVLRDGRNVGTCEIASTNPDQLIQMMVGRPLSEEFPAGESARGGEILRVEHLTNSRIHDVSFTLQRGEVLGVGGLGGAGRSELLRAIFAADPVESGAIFLDGNQVQFKTPGAAVKAGFGLLTEDRNLQGLFLQMTVRENITISNLRDVSSGLFIAPAADRSAAERFASNLSVKAPSVDAGVETLSGGNRQKVILARWLFARSRVLLVDEPTAGIDVGVKHEIYLLLQDLARNGVGVIVVTSDMQELLGLCSRIVVLSAGRVAGELVASKASQEEVMRLAMAYV